jgi:hypothetical protein
MIKSISRDPAVLLQTLKDQRTKVHAQMKRSRAAGDVATVQKLRASLYQLNDSIETISNVVEADNIGNRNFISADDEEQVDDFGGEDEESFEDEEQEAPEQDDELQEEDQDDEAQDDEQDDEPETPVNEEADVEVTDENPLAMTKTLRKEIGDAAADVLDEYARSLHSQVISFFEKLMSSSLTLSQPNGLRKLITDETGKRGIKSVEPVFEEWRASVIKHLTKDIMAMFEPPPQPEDEVEVPPGAPEPKQEPKAAPKPAPKQEAPKSEPAPKVEPKQEQPAAAVQASDFRPAFRRSESDIIAELAAQSSAATQYSASAPKLSRSMDTAGMLPEMVEALQGIQGRPKSPPPRQETQQEPRLATVAQPEIRIPQRVSGVVRDFRPAGVTKPRFE